MPARRQPRPQRCSTSSPTSPSRSGRTLTELLRPAYLAMGDTTADHDLPGSANRLLCGGRRAALVFPTRGRRHRGHRSVDFGGSDSFLKWGLPRGDQTARRLRNVAIVAHVDHGKTTLVDAMLWQSGAFCAHRR